jgi:transposase
MSGKRLSDETRAEIATLYEFMSMGDIAKRYSVSRNSVFNIIKKKKMFGTVADRPRKGRPRISNARDDRFLIRLSLTNRFLTAPCLLRAWHVKASLSTIKNRLLSVGLGGCIAKRKQPLTALHKQKRLEWCLARRQWTVEQWREVRFTDESAFCLLPNTIRQVVRRREGEEMAEGCVAISHKWRTPKLMVWGAVSGSGVGPLHRCAGTVNQHVYKSILENHVNYLAEGPLVQDNAPCHKTLLVRHFLEENGIEAMPWPSCSPDLNPIEHVWNSMKVRIQGKKYSDKQVLWNELNTIWNGFSLPFIRRFVDSMPRRVKAVIQAHGGVTRF